MKKKKVKLFGLFGFAGFLGFQYFINYDVSCLFYFSFFSFFSYFVLGKLTEATPDERYIENSNKARLKSSIIPLVTLFIIGWSTSLSFTTEAFIVVVSALGWSLTIIVYAILFLYYEKH